MSFDRLQSKIDEMNNPTVAGLDPTIEQLPPHILNKSIALYGNTLKAAANGFLEFNKGIIDALCDIVPAVKPQSAYYERLGSEGVAALKETADYASLKGMYVIFDGKRNDIGSTATAYSDAYLGTITIGGEVLEPFKFDAMTVNPYLGSDGIKPFIDTAVQRDKAIFALVKTSNPSSGEVQDKITDGNTRLYESVGDLLELLAGDTVGEYGYTRVGAVVGATYRQEIKQLRERLRKTFFLVPGYGAQGGTAADAACAFTDGRGAIINSSRGIIAAWKKTGLGGFDYAEASRGETVKMRDALRREIYG